MTSKKTLLPPNATAAELAIDQAEADAMKDIPTQLIQQVKNPSLCPSELLPWLAWEFQVDTWNINWPEQKKRDAISRAHYIHSHRGTPEAVRRALTDIPFSSDIIEWFRQDPPGAPYTFRMNVEQGSLPVSEFDHQDLKMAVLRAKNLRSWFSIHVYGNSTGWGFGYGYVMATEKISSNGVITKTVPTGGQSEAGV